MMVSVFDDGLRNRSEVEAPYSVATEARELHESLLVADMHADPLMMDRGDMDGIRRRNRRGHVDLPRLLDGNVGIQMLTVVSQAALDSGPPFCRWPDGMGVISRGQGWPRATWRSARARAMYQAEKWRRLAEHERVRKILWREDLERFLEANFCPAAPAAWRRQAAVPRKVAILLGLEGVHAFDTLSNDSTDEEIHREVSHFLAAGFRMFGINHNFDNDFGTASEGELVIVDGVDPGLTPLGKRVAKVLARRGAIFEVAHASPASIDDLFDLHAGPVIYSHGGIRAHTDVERNLETRHVAEIGRRGGVICIGYWKEVVGETSVDAILDAIEKTVEVLSAEPAIEYPWNHVGIGSDFDGAVNTLFNCDGHCLLTAGMMERGYPETIIRRVMGGNVAEFLLRTLPGKPGQSQRTTDRETDSSTPPLPTGSQPVLEQRWRSGQPRC